MNFLAATGCRATEALSIRLRDLDFTKNTVFIRGEFTKTKTDRYVFLTSELVQQIKDWLNYKYRTRKISHQKDRTVEKRTPSRKPDDLVFSSGSDPNGNPTLESLYVNMVMNFERTLDRMGGKYAEVEGNVKPRRRITLHSFRRHVKSTISDLGYSDYSEWFIGHAGSVYYKKPMAEKFQLFKKIEPYLIYLDFASLERKGADIQTRIEELEQENQELKELKGRFDKLEPLMADFEKVRNRLGI